MEDLVPSPTMPAERRYALVVGVNAAAGMPHAGPLKGAEAQAREVAEVVRSVCGCELVCEPLLGVQATSGAVREALKTLAVRRSEQDLLLFYFAGHGSLHEDATQQRHVYLVASDFDAQAVEDGEDFDALSLGLLREWLYEKTKAGRVLVLLDCCYAGNSGRVAQDAPLDSLLALFKDYLGATSGASKQRYRVTLAATGHDIEAWEDERGGLWTQHLLAALRGTCRDARDEEGEVTVGRLHDVLYKAMPATQKPSFSGDTAGKGLVLVSYPELADRVQQAQQRAQRQHEREDFLRVFSTAPEGERFLRERLASFVGRVQELRDIEQRIAQVQPGGGYVTISGLAGQGKSSIIAALIARVAPTPQARVYIPFHFIPFNPGPDYQVSLLRNLMARLISRYGLSDLYVASADRPTLREFFPKVLHEVAEKGGREIIYIDGLDQIERDANGVRDLTFLPTNPPAGMVFVLGTRPDDTLKPLTLLKPTQSYLLPPMSYEDFVTLLEARHAPAMEPHFVEQLYKKMERNALYLDLLARELRDQGAVSSVDLESIIQQLAEDPDNIFSLTLERLERQRQDWHEVIRPLLGILLVAQEPLTPWQLRTILNLNHAQVKQGLDVLSGLVIHPEERYALYHLKFRDFLHQNVSYGFPQDEEEEWQARLVQWCERETLATLWEESSIPNEQSRRLYVRRHYVTHLYEARQWERLFAVLDEGSYGRGKERDDVEARSYIEDLRKGSRAATWDGWTYEQHLHRLPRLWRYTLLRSSIRSQVDGYPLALFEAMLALGKEREVLGLAGLLTQPERKVDVLMLLAAYLLALPQREREGMAMCLRAEDVAHSIQDESQQAVALAALVSVLAQAQQWEQAQQVAGTIQSAYRQAQALVALVTALAQAQQWEQAQQVAGTIQDAYSQPRALVALVTALAQAQQWEQAQQVAGTIQDAESQGEALVALVTALAQAQQWEQAQQVAGTIQDTYSQPRALVALVTALAQAQQWEQAQQVAGTIQDAYGQALVLAVLASALTQAQRGEQARRVLEQAQEVAGTIQDAESQWEALVALVTALAQAQQWEQARRMLEQAQQVAGTIQDTYQQGEALAVLASALAQAQQWEQAQQVVGTIQNADWQEEALVALVTELAQAQQWEQAQEVAGTIQGYQRLWCVLVTALAQAQQWEQAQQVAHSIQDAYGQALALAVLASALTQAQRGEQARRVLEQAQEVAGMIQDAESQWEALAALASALAQAQQWEQAQEVAGTIQGVYSQEEALVALVTALAQAQQWEQAQEVAGTIQHAGWQARALVALASALAQVQQWEQAQEVAGTIQSTDWQGEALVALASALAQVQQWELAQEVAGTIQGVYSQEEALVALVTALAQAQQWELAQEVAGTIQHAGWQARALVALVTALAQAQQWELAQEVAGTIQHAYRQGEALVALASALAQAQQWEQARRVLEQAQQVAGTIQDAESQGKALVALASVLAQAQQWEQARRVFEQAQQVAGTIQSAGWQAQALVVLASALAQAQQWELAQEVAHSIQDADRQAQALAALASALAERGHFPQLLSLVQRSWQSIEARDDALRRFPLVSGLIIQTPALGMELFEAFQWVEAFLHGT